MPSTNTQFETELKNLIATRMAEIGDILCEGQATAVKDHAQYQHYVGQFYALRQVHDDFCQQANTTLNQR